MPSAKYAELHMQLGENGLAKLPIPSSSRKIYLAQLWNTIMEIKRDLAPLFDLATTIYPPPQARDKTLPFLDDSTAARLSMLILSQNLWHRPPALVVTSSREQLRQLLTEHWRESCFCPEWSRCNSCYFEAALDFPPY